MSFGGARLYAFILTVLVFYPVAPRAEEKELFAVIELGSATERSIQEGTYSTGPSASIEFPVIKNWLEIEAGNLAPIPSRSDRMASRSAFQEAIHARQAC